MTIGDKKGKVLLDPEAKLSHYLNAPKATLYFKDLGPQVGWSTVFYVEYAGPIVITLALLLLRRSIYGSDPEL